ncbi:MAG: HEPN domain-containing protein [Chitinophagales bacterium]
MSYTKEDLIQYRLKKAANSLEEVKTLAEINHWDTVANILYYSCFYAVTAYFAQQDIKAITHTGIKSAFHQTLIKTGLLNIEFGKLYNDLFNKRQEADYKDFVSFEAEIIEPLIEEVEVFVEKMEELI